MSGFFDTLRRFGKDEGGAFAVLFGVMLIVLVATAGAVADFVLVEQARGRAQLALDTAVLALQPQIYTQEDAAIKQAAEDLVIERLADSTISVDMEGISTNEDNGTLFLEARLTVPMYFVTLVGISELNARIHSQATRKKNYVEVAMVLDNSGSMNSYSRMSHLKTAAANATEILFDGAATSINVKIGIVPFTSFVNIGSSRSNSPWLDTAGQSSIAADNFDNDDDESTPFSGPVNRLAIYNQLSNVSWGGCVDARPHTVTGAGAHLDTDDTTPDNSNPDTLFVPAFGPDTPDSWASWQGDYEDDDNACATSAWSLSNRERQERLCKYSGWTSTSGWGPNFDCPSAELLPLSDTKQTVLNAINAMVASGATNIHMGTIWGFRVVSPPEPFTEAREYDEANAKALIIMTDGENTMYSSSNMNGAHYYSPYGFPFNGRIGAVGWSNTQLQAEMNVRTVESCDNAKAQDIVVYTIGLSTPNSTTRTMLENCATDLAHAYFPSAPSELDSVFSEIANQLGALRLSL